MIPHRSLPWPDLGEWEIPSLPMPDLPIPDLPIPELPGVAAQYAVAIPLVAAALGLLLTRRSSRAAAWAAVLGSLLTLVVVVGQAYALTRVEGPGIRTADTIGPLAFGELTVPLELTAYRLTALTAVVVGLVAVVVQLFARWYLWYDPRYRQFSATVSLFTGAMLLVVLSGDVLLTLIGWEVMGWCSYLLIGHLSGKDSANRAAIKALLVTRLADVGMWLGLIALAAPAGSTRITDIIEHWVVVDADGTVATRPGGGVLLALAMIGVVVAVAGKSAQVPFQDWLPDAMEGPTPASALIHAATMVAAGTVVLTQLFPLLQASDPARTLLAVLASVTVVGAALLAFAQPDLKRMLAWSTVSQIGLMLAALTIVPVGAGPDAAILHLASHGVFKALLFLALGWLSVLTGGTAVAYVVSGLTRYRSVRRPMAIGLLSLAGVPPMVGFVSKELILSQAEVVVSGAGAGFATTLVLAAVGASVPLTAAYCMRAWLVLARDQPVRAPRNTGHERIDDFFAEPEVVHEAEGVEEAEAAISASARFGISVLGFLSVVGGVLAFTPVIEVDVHVDLQLLIAALVLMALAAFAVWIASRGIRSRDAAARLPVALSLAAERGLGAGALYQRAVVRPVLALARAVTWADRDVLDGYVRATAHGSRVFGRLGDRSQPWRPAGAMALVLLGVVVLGAVGVVLG
ncbi:NADH-quinone oxidoreductase subunit L [Ornithinicoccus hortensis]|uniref:NADH-quinone oxidoreductase subunit L n=1 Tax=Ornithinicoccus hortensis TaxID=82346 RepID=A0A542YPI1_9MICO|nr:NADH-quinone oxidoreductase subunit L [Ornithinicoccus hortensis]TQL49959.1 NADH-quinone oxidoreductase subunit L [Ornithinicoccus hortensis]